MPESPARLTLYHRRDCHLCEDMLLQLREMQQQRPFELVLSDVDRDPELAERYGPRIPVLASDREVICSGYLDPVATNGFLDSVV
jgi:hypothetical protein